MVKFDTLEACFRALGRPSLFRFRKTRAVARSELFGSILAESSFLYLFLLLLLFFEIVWLNVLWEGLSLGRRGHLVNFDHSCWRRFLILYSSIEHLLERTVMVGNWKEKNDEDLLSSYIGWVRSIYRCRAIKSTVLPILRQNKRHA